ncbi:MAG TPA: thioredoxin family protein [Roseiflexaceae bacterium]|nr:thioredoxin family protein [Roseiflexaceae bacterium]
MLRRSFPALLALLALLLAGCGQQTTSSDADTVQPVFAFTEAVVGPNRMALGLVRNQTPLNDPQAKVHLRLFGPDNTSGTPSVEADATYYGQGLPVGFYVAYPNLDKPGEWRVEIQAQAAGQTSPSISRQRLEVKPSSDVPNVGDQAVAVKTLTIKDVPDPAQLSSGKEIDPAMYQISLDQALASGKPTAVLFATPGFCRTATCGPSLNVLQALRPKYGDWINFIHAEVYRYPFPQSVQAQQQAAEAAMKQGRLMTPEEARAGFSDAMAAWGLASEPWLYLIDAKGVIAARYEGGITEQELAPDLERLAAGQPIR